MSEERRVVRRALRPRAWLVAAAGISAVVLAHWRVEHIESRVDSFEHTFAHVRWSWVLAAIAFNVLAAVAGAFGWDTVVRQAIAPPHPRRRDVFSAFSVGLLGNIVLPGRVGEVARIAVLARRLASRRGIWATLVGTVVAYRLLDLLPALGLIAYTIIYAPNEIRVLRWNAKNVSKTVFHLNPSGG